MRLPRPLARLLLGAVLLGGLPPLRAFDDIKPGTRLDLLTVGSTTYRQVLVRSVNARTVVITHAEGMTSIRLRDLSPEWQARFHYNAAIEAAPKVAAQPASSAPAGKPRPPAAPKKESKFDVLLRSFGQPAAVQTEIDLRPKFFALELSVKNQGRRPSCAIFSIVSALEFQNAELAGHAEKFSEEYLTWAVRKTVQRLPAPGVTPDDSVGKDDVDEGFALSEVVAALRAYGIPLQSSMPNTFGRKIDAIEEPPALVVEEARNHQRVFVHQLPGRDNATRINNVVQALNSGVPVAVGMAWPNYRSLRTGYLNAQKPMTGSGHAVTLVGYRSVTGRLEDAVFIFKNSWGVDWGQGGYGTVTYSYLNNYLNDAVLLEVQSG
ncbi:MAG: C1 family peptidase [Opitutae bacterium]|nr:C1 family peptidase [Opitutae bacterium]